MLDDTGGGAEQTEFNSVFLGNVALLQVAVLPLFYPDVRSMLMVLLAFKGHQEVEQLDMEDLAQLSERVKRDTMSSSAGSVRATLGANAYAYRQTQTRTYACVDLSSKLTTNYNPVLNAVLLDPFFKIILWPSRGVCLPALVGVSVFLRPCNPPSFRLSW